MLVSNRMRFPYSRDVVWFASGEYSTSRFRARVTYLRQHSMDIPLELIVSDERFYTLFLDLSHDVDDLKSRFTKTFRYDINRSRKEAITHLRQEIGGEGGEAFVERHRAFNLKKGLGRSLTTVDLMRLKGSLRLYSAFKGEEPLADILLISDGFRARQWVVVNNTNHPSRNLVGYASKALVWESIQDAKASNHQIYDFGGIVLDENDPRHGITEYKRSFGGRLVEERNTLVVRNRVDRAVYGWLRKVAKRSTHSRRVPAPDGIDDRRKTHVD